MVFKRKGSSYYYYRFVRNGVVVYECTKQKNKDTARDLENDHRIRLAKGEAGLPTGKVPTLAQFKERFLKAVKTRSADKPRTIEYYENNYDRLLDFAPMKNARLDAIEAAVIERFIQSCTGAAVATINRRLAVLRRILRLAQEWRVTVRVPRIRLLAGENMREYVISRQREGAYLEACGYPLRQMATLMLDTGLRRNEAVGLCWNQVRLDEGYIQVIAGKTANAKRTIPLTARATELLGSMPQVDDYVFTSGKGAYSPTHLDHLHAAVRVELDLPKQFVLHSLRHTFGTRLGESGADAFTIQRLMGHSSITVSARYVHPASESLKNAINGLDRGRVGAMALKSEGEKQIQSLEA